MPDSNTPSRPAPRGQRRPSRRAFFPLYGRRILRPCLSMKSMLIQLRLSWTSVWDDHHEGNKQHVSRKGKTEELGKVPTHHYQW